MNTLTKLAVASLFVAAPSLAFGQKPAKVHTTATVVKPHAVVEHLPKNDAAEDAAKRADKIADKTEKTEEKSEHLALKRAHEERKLDKGLKLTPTQKRQWEVIEKNYDQQYRNLRKSEETADRTARKTNTVDNDAAFNAQLSSLQVNERNALRATLTIQQQSIFDANVLNLSKPKH